MHKFICGDVYEAASVCAEALDADDDTAGGYDNMEPQISVKD